MAKAIAPKEMGVHDMQYWGVCPRCYALGLKATDDE